MTVQTLIGPDGREYEFDDAAPGANLQAALQSGFRVATDEGRTTGETALGALSDVGDVANAASLGVLGGLTGGVSDVAIGASASPGAKREAKSAKEEHPYAHLAGELTGAVASPLNLVGEGIVGAVAPVTRAGRIASQATGGAAVGSLFGAGSALSEAALGDVNLTAEHLLASAGLGALLGGAGGALGAAVEEGARAVMPKAGRLLTDAQKTLDDVASDATVAATRAQQAVIKRIGEPNVAEAAKVIRDRHLKGTPASMLESIGAEVGTVGPAKGAFLDAAEAAGTAPSTSGFLKAIDDFSAGLGPTERKTIQSELNSAREAFLEIGARPAGTTGKTGSGWRAFDAEKQVIQAKGKFSSGAVGVDDVTLGLKRQLAGVVREELDRQLIPALGKDAEAFLSTKKLYGALKDAERLAESGATRAKPGGLGFGMYDLLAGGAGAIAHPAGLAAAVASKFAREHGPALIAKTADAIAKSPALVAVAQSMGKSLAGFAPQLGQYAAPIAAAFGTSPAVGLATHMAMAQTDPGYAATAQLAGLTPEGPEEHGAALGRAQGLADVAAASNSTDELINKHVASILKGGGKAPSIGHVMKGQDFGSKRMRRSELDSHAKRVEEIRQMATDPMALVDRVAGNLSQIGPVAPGVSAALTAQADRAVKYLAEAAREPPKPGPLAAPWVPSEAQRFEFNQKLQVVEQPLSVLEHAAAGTLTPTQVSALRTVYPRLYETISHRALEQALGAKDVPYRQRLMLSMLTGMDLDGTTSADALIRNQEAIRGKNLEQENAAPPDSGSRSESTLGARMALPNQRRDMEAP